MTPLRLGILLVFDHSKMQSSFLQQTMRRCIFGLAGAVPASAVLAVFSGTKAVHTGIDTCVLKYFGPQSNVVEASALFLEGNALCKPEADAVRGKVVIGNMYGASSCNYISAYRRLDAAGAVAFVKLVAGSPPGWSTVFDHDAWDSSETREMTMTMVEVFKGDLGIGLEEAASTADFRAFISPPHNTEWEDEYTSVAWLIAMRIVTPLCGLVFVVRPGFIETHSLWWALGCDENPAFAQMRKASFAVCLIASVCSFIICLLLVLGQNAAQVAPASIHNVFFTSFAGTTVLTTSINCAVLSEKYRSRNSQSLQIRVLTKQYPLSLVMVTLLGPGVDFFVVYLRVSSRDQSVGFRIMHTAAGVIVSLIQGFVGLIFLYFARALGNNLLAYMSLRRSISNQYNPVLQQLSAVVMALFMNGVLLITNFLHTFLYVILMRSRETPVAIVRGYLVLLPVLRMGLFYWQVLHDLSLIRGHDFLKAFSNMISVSVFRFN
jgi:hypothetical protein